MLLKAGNKILKSPNGFLKITPDGDIILTFTVRGTCFPTKLSNGNTITSYFRFVSTNNVDNKVFIDFNDGTGEHEYNFYSNGAARRIDFRNLANGTTPETIQGSTWSDAPVYFYQDLPPEKINTVDEVYEQYRDITVRFEKPQNVTQIYTYYTRLFGVFPSGISKFRNLTILSSTQAAFIESFAQDFYQSSIRDLTISVMGNVMNDGFPNWILNSSFLHTLNLNDSIDLSGNPVDKKFNQINKLKETLINLNISNTGINYQIPEEFNELSKLESLTMISNMSPLMAFPDDVSGLTSLNNINAYGTRMVFSEIEKIVQNIPSLKLLNIGICNYSTDYDFTSNNSTLEEIYIGNQTWNSGAVPSFINKLIGLKTLNIFHSASTTLNNSMTSYGNFSDAISIESIGVVRQRNFTTTIPSWFSDLINLKAMNVQASFQNTGGIDSFVNNFYDFVVSEASMSVGDTPFRNMLMNAYGSNTTDQNNSTRPSGTYQEPSGYVQGSNNGTPASQMEKIWVLTNQYGHTWTVKPA